MQDLVQQVVLQCYWRMQCMNTTVMRNVKSILTYFQLWWWHNPLLQILLVQVCDNRQQHGPGMADNVNNPITKGLESANAYSFTNQPLSKEFTSLELVSDFFDITRFAATTRCSAAYTSIAQHQSKFLSTTFHITHMTLPWSLLDTSKLKFTLDTSLCLD